MIAAALLLVTGVLTNDLHRLMFKSVGNEVQYGAWGSYSSGVLWYIFYAYVAVCFPAGLILLAVRDRRRGSGRRALPAALISLSMFGMMMLGDRLFSLWQVYWPFAFPETSVFCMLGIFESCIRSRLIPYNENYVGFFEDLDLPAVITDNSFHTVYRTSAPFPASAEDCKRALSTYPVSIGDLRLYGRTLKGGCAFWISDMSEMRRLNEELENASEALESENDLLVYENRQKEERAKVDARNRVYAKAASEVYEAQKKAARYLESAPPGSASFAEDMAKVLVLNAYVKRKTNLVLLASEQKEVTAQELFLALDESARFLFFCGVRASAEKTADRAFPVGEASALYDAFEEIVEALWDDIGALMVCLTDEGLRLLTDCVKIPAIGSRASILAEEEDGQLYLTVRAKGGEEV